MNILIGIPSKGTIDIECAVSIMNLDWDGHNITYTHCKGSGIYGVAQARNNLVQQAIDGGFDKLFMIDSDMIVPEDAIINLLDPDVPIVTGCDGSRTTAAARRYSQAYRTRQARTHGCGMRFQTDALPFVPAALLVR